MAQVLEQYNDPSLAAIVQPVKWSTPWSVLPKASDFDPNVSNAARIPTIDWQWQFWEDDLRADLTDYLVNVIGMPIGDGIKDLPGLYLTTVYQNIFLDNATPNSGALMVRIDNQLISAPHAIAPMWIAYWIALYMQDQLNAAPMTPESQYRMKICADMSKVLAYMLSTALTSNPSISKGVYLIVCNTKSAVERITLFVDYDYLSEYLDAGKTVDALCVNFFNSGANPQQGIDF